jgi:hypothetical protein
MRYTYEYTLLTFIPRYIQGLQPNNASECDIDRRASIPYFVHACMVVDMTAARTARLRASHTSRHNKYKHTSI